MLRFGVAVAALLTMMFGGVTSARAQRTGALRAAASTRVEVASEQVELDCRVGASPDELECDLRAHWTLRNRGPEIETAQVVLTWPHDAAAALRVGAGEASELPVLRPLAVIVPPDRPVELELRATLPLDAPFAGGAHDVASPLTPLDPLQARHPLLAEPWERTRRGFAWLPPDDLRFAAVGPTTIEAHLPGGWHPAGDLRATDDPRIARYVSPAVRVARHVDLELTRGGRGELLRHGGPFVALGGTIDAGIRARFGYELGLGEFVLASVALDTDFEREVLVAPQVELASWGMVIVPSLALGLGVPIRVTERDGLPRTVGIRIEASATFFAAAFVATLDVWPADATWQLSLLGRIGL